MPERRVYWLRREGSKEPASTEVFMDLVAAKGFAQGLATMTATRLEIVREDGSVAVAVDPEIPPSLRHVPKVVEEPAEGEPVYTCQLCGRVGSSDTMHDEECPKRSGVLRKITLIHDEKPPGS